LLGKEWLLTAKECSKTCTDTIEPFLNPAEAETLVYHLRKINTYFSLLRQAQMLLQNEGGKRTKYPIATLVRFSCQKPTCNKTNAVKKMIIVLE